MEVNMRLLIILLVFFSLLVTGTASADVLIITNKNVSEDSMSQDDIKNIFLGKKSKWKDKTKVHFVVSDNPDIHQTFLKSYVKKTPKQFKAYWKNMVFTGQGKKPKEFKSTEELLKYVEKTDGAIGYIDSDTTVVNVNTLSIE